eukprot:3230017-Rhodomonas_salina.1
MAVAGRGGDRGEGGRRDVAQEHRPARAHPRASPRPLNRAFCLPDFVCAGSRCAGLRLRADGGAGAWGRAQVSLMYGSLTVALRVLYSFDGPPMVRPPPSRLPPSSFSSCSFAPLLLLLPLLRCALLLWK